MTKAIRLGHIRYVNTLPLYYLLLQKRPTDVELFSDIPSKVNQAFLEGVTDISMISTMTYLKHLDQMDLLPSTVLSSDGAVHSVLLLSNHPIEGLYGKRIGLTHASATSQTVLKILLKRFYKVQPIYETVSSLPANGDARDYDAMLWIGDDALALKQDSFPYRYDLAELWKEHTGAEIIFAVFVKQKNISQKDVDNIQEWFQRSLELYQNNPEEILSYAEENYKLDINYHEYFQRLQYQFTNESQRAMEVMKTLSSQLETDILSSSASR